MSILGSLRDASLVEVIQFLNQQSKTGTLRAWTGDAAVAVVLHKGNIIGASGPRTRRLGHILVTAGVLNEETLRSAVNQQRTEQPPRPLGRILVALGAVSDLQIQHAVEAQVVATISEVVAWKSGQFEFVPHDIKPVDYIAVAPGKVFPRVSINPEAALIEAMRISDERQHKTGAMGALAEPMAAPPTAAVAAAAVAAAGAGSPTGTGPLARGTMLRAESGSVRPMDTSKEAGRNIGFYDGVEFEGRVYHVQTEVAGHRALTIRSTVLDGGAVVLFDKQPYPDGETDVEAIRKIIEAQHQQIVGRTSRGEFERG